MLRFIHYPCGARTDVTVLTLLLLQLVLPGTGRAQGTDAAIGGRVSSTTGAPIADAMVTVRNTSTGFVSSVRTTAAGQYVFAQLPLGGPYHVTARRVGFEPVTKSGYQLTLGARVRADFTLAERAASLAPV